MFGHPVTPEPQTVLPPQPTIQVNIPHSNKISPIYVRQHLNFKIGNYQKIRLFVALILLVGLSVSFILATKRIRLNKPNQNFLNIKLN